MISMKWRPDDRGPPVVDSYSDLPDGPFRLPVEDPSPFFQANPLFADRADGEWFLARCWNQVPPAVGGRQGKSVIAQEDSQYLVLQRYGEGVIFDAAGTASSPGFLGNMPVLPSGMVRSGDEFQLDPRVLENAPKLFGTWIIFYNGNLQNYFHWLVEGMLSLELLDLNPNLSSQTVLPQHLPPHGQFDHLNIMQLLGHQRVEVTRTAAPFVWCERVLHLEHIENFPASRLRSFQSRVAERFGLNDKPGNKILVNRKSLRSIANIRMIRDLLLPLGFQMVELEDLTAEAQIRLFGGAEWVVGPHGAGLSNLVYSPPGCRVIEFMPESEMRPFFWDIGSKLGHIYGMLPCPTDDGGFNGRLMVDIDKFRALFSMVGTQR